jgi:hypothetical protein
MEEESRRREEFLMSLPFAEQTLSAVIMLALAPFAFALYLFRTGHSLAAVAVLGTWIPPAALLALWLHRRRIVRLPVALFAVSAFIATAALVVWEFW